jgi:O-antigen/teichoic acid export membrane protein
MEEELTEDIQKRAIQSVKWDYLVLILPRILAPFTTIVLARFLLPDDYGIVGISTLIVALAGVLRDFGIREVVIQRRDFVPEATNAAFWLSSGVAIIMAIGIFFSAPFLASFFNDLRVIPVLKVQCWQLIVMALGGVQSSLLQREFKFKLFAGIAVVPSLMPLVIAVPLAVQGLGYWSIIIAQLIGESLRTVLLWWKVSWRPSFQFNNTVTREVLNFGGMITIGVLGAWGLSHGANLAIGRFGTTADLGIFSMGYSLVFSLLGVIAAPFTSTVSYSALSRLSESKEDLQRIFLKISKLFALVIFPASVGFSLVGPLVVSIAFNESWKTLGPVISILALMGPAFLSSTTRMVYSAIGRPDIGTKITLFCSPIVILIYVFCAQTGLLWFCWGRVLVALVLWLPDFFVISSLTGIRPINYWRHVKRPIFATIGMAISIMPFVLLLPFPSQKTNWNIGFLVFVISIGCVSYFSLMWCFDKNAIFSFLKLLRKGLPGGVMRPMEHIYKRYFSHRKL